VFAALVDGLAQSPTSRASIWYHLADTLTATLIGFVIGSVLGLVLAALMAEFRAVERLLFPYIAAIQSLPKVAIAPLYVIWFGYQIESKVAMAATLALFPVLLNALQGLLSVERDRRELMASLDASRWQMFWLVRLPNSLPLIFAGLNLGIVYGLLGALVAEFIGAQRGMGVMVMQLQSVNDTAGVFAILVVLAVVGYGLIAAMRMLQHRIVFWSGDTRRNDVA
jgi:NitT/TauT family transport system permease protein